MDGCCMGSVASIRVGILWSLWPSDLHIHFIHVIALTAVLRVSCRLIVRSFHIDFNYELLRLPDRSMGLRAGVIGWQGVSTPHNNLMPALMSPKVRIYPMLNFVFFVRFLRKICSFYSLLPLIVFIHCDRVL